MRKPENNSQTQEQQALGLLKELLLYKSAQAFREDLNSLFYAYLETQNADCLADRVQMKESHGTVVQFLSAISNLQEINIYGKN